MANDIPDFMRGFDIDEDWGFTAVPDKPSATPAIDPEKLDTTNVEVAKVKQSVDDIKARMGEIMQIVAENKVKAETEMGEDIEERFKGIEKIILPFLYNLSKTDDAYIHWPNRGPIIKEQIQKILKLTRG
tara:strand:+ start:5676 stop:6065 length:390 start_codon:yes stop_codon:yes gene_type:complete